jgi:hypothetical protein
VTRSDMSPSFENDIKPLFRESDRSAMLSRFDLWSFDDVRNNADAILASVTNGVMPCDGKWQMRKSVSSNAGLQAAHANRRAADQPRGLGRVRLPVAAYRPMRTQRRYQTNGRCQQGAPRSGPQC